MRLRQVYKLKEHIIWNLSSRVNKVVKKRIDIITIVNLIINKNNLQPKIMMVKKE